MQGIYPYTKCFCWQIYQAIFIWEQNNFGGDFFCRHQGRSQDFSVGTHSFPSHLFTPAPPPQKRSKSFSIHVSFISNRVRKSLNWMQINLFFCLLFLWVSMCERHCLSCESTTFCSSPFASIYVTYYKKQQCVHGFITPTDKNSI